MATFDPTSLRICIRIVYDGAEGAGKTANLRALGGLLPNATALVSPGPSDGPTTYFDLLQVPSGAVAGIPLLCQIVSVPGQTALTPRRRQLLASADAVVFVTASDAGGLARAKRALARAGRATRDVPLVVQANGQDHPDASPASAVRVALGQDAPVVEAVASSGVGVVDTLLAAVRLVTRDLQSRADADALSLETVRVAAADELLARLEGPLDATWAAEMLLEEVQAALEAAAGPVPKRPRSLAPTAPGGDIESGYVWPADGRILLEALPPLPPVVVDEAGAVELVAGGYVLRTLRPLRFTDPEEAQRALVRAARERTLLDEALAVPTVLALQAARDGAWWLWTVTSRMPGLDAAIDALVDATPLVAAYGRAVAGALHVCLAGGFAVDLRPGCFGLHDGEVGYTGVLALDAGEPGAAVASALDAVEARGWDAAIFLCALERGLATLTPDDATRLARATGNGTASPSRARLERALAAIASGGRLDPAPSGLEA